MKKRTEKDCPYEPIEQLGHGGNAGVFVVQNKRAGKHAAKVLNQNCSGWRLKERKARFANEIKVMSDNCGSIPGIIPIYEASYRGCWYTMPIATPIMQYIRDNHSSVKDIVIGVTQLAQTLTELHRKQLSHRDIKPANIYYYNNRYYLGDFGLVDIPDDTGDLTRSDKALGAVFTMAPEMRRDPKNADGRKADVYSLAKSLWMLLTGNEKGFDGQYNYNDREISLSFIVKDRNAYYVELDELLVKATDNKPENRPDMETFRMLLEQWSEAFGNGEMMDRNRWSFLNKILFGNAIPETAIWEDAQDIVNVLNQIPIANSYSHMLFSSGGGMDFSSAEMANESGCIYIKEDNGAMNLLKPKALRYEGFRGFEEWNYFLLDADELPTILSDEAGVEYEKLVEDYPGHYVTAQGYTYGVYDYDTGEKLPHDSRLVFRYNKGRFLFVLKTGPYNHISSTYDGRHGNYSPERFRRYVMEVISAYERILKKSGGNKEFAARIISQITSKPLSEIESEVDNRKSEEVEQSFLNNIESWNFSSEIISIKTDAPMRFWIIINTGLFHVSIVDLKSYILCDDGMFHSGSSSCKPFYFYDRQEAIESVNKIEQKIVEYVPDGYPSFSEYYINCGISMKLAAEKSGQPSHLFTQEEMREAMVGADDRLTNTMVIDEKGFVKVLPSLENAGLYPVVFESSPAGGNHVGKYADFSDIDREYHMALSFWLYYLKTGNTQFANIDIDQNTTEELIGEIKSIMGDDQEKN